MVAFQASFLAYQLWRECVKDARECLWPAVVMDARS
jgi:hypothetical protein